MSTKAQKSNTERFTVINPDKNVKTKPAQEKKCDVLMYSFIVIKIHNTIQKFGIACYKSLILVIFEWSVMFLVIYVILYKELANVLYLDKKKKFYIMVQQHN